MEGLGGKIKVLRKKQGLTLIEMGEKAEIDPATLSRIENGKMPGTLDSHLKIAEVLGIRLPELYEDVLTEQGEVEAQGTKEKVETFSHSSGAVAQLLTAAVLQKKMMPILLKIKSGGYTESEEYPLLTERFIYVLKGALALYLGNEKRLLREGESFYFGASRPHYLKNSSKKECQVLSVITPVSL